MSETTTQRAPRVSVVTPVFNGAAFVGTAIASVLAQTMTDLELLVVDDGSSDDTRAVVARFADPRLHFVAQPHRGVSATRNAGIERSRAPWIAFLDADDRWAPTKLEEQLARVAKVPDADMVYCGAISQAPDGSEIRRAPAELEGYVFDALIRGNQITGSASSVLVRRDTLDKVGYFDEQLPCCEDWDLWLRIAAVGRVACVREPLVFLLSRPGSLGHKADLMRETGLRVIQRTLGARSPHGASPPAMARWNLYYNAAIAHQQSGALRSAMFNLLASIRCRPTYLPAYWRLARALAFRR
jgi:glycosyltransferase involved in cell wall biosynthesis